MQQETTNRPRNNPRARDAGDVLGATLPDTISAATWVRPYEYLVVRTDSRRLTRLDDHEKGIVMSGGLHTRHNAVGRRAILKRRNPEATYEIHPVENSEYDEEWK